MKARTLTRETILNLGVTERNFPDFKVGDTIEVAQIVKDGGKSDKKSSKTDAEKERIQLFEGDVIAYRNNGIASTMTVRRISANGIGVERIFPLHAPFISGIRLVRSGVVRRAKLYYVRDRIGKAARIKEKVLTREQKAEAAQLKKTRAHE